MIRFDKKVLGSCTSLAYSQEVPVRFQDVDAAGIVFFVRFFEYVHTAFEGFLSDVGLPLPRILRDGTWVAPLRHAEADYLSPARFGDVLTVELVAAHLEESEMSLGWRVRRRGDEGKPCAIVQTAHTFIRPSNFEKISLPREIFLKLRSVELP